MSQSKILTSLLDEIVCLAWLLLHNVNELFFSLILFWDVKVKVYLSSLQNIRDIFSGCFPPPPFQLHSAGILSLS